MTKLGRAFLRVGAMPLARQRALSKAEGWSRVALRRVWPRERGSMVGWLASAAGRDMLACLLARPIREAALEIPLSHGRADLVLELAEGVQDRSGSSRVVVEATLEAADLDHALRLMHYASELEACAAVLVAPKLSGVARQLLAEQNCAGIASAPSVYGTELSCWRHRSSRSIMVRLAQLLAPAPVRPSFRQAEGSAILAPQLAPQDLFLSAVKDQLQRRSGVLERCFRLSAGSNSLLWATSIAGIDIEAGPEGLVSLLVNQPDSPSTAALCRALRQNRSEFDAGAADLDLLWAANLQSAEFSSPRHPALVRISGRRSVRGVAATASAMLSLHRAFEIHLSGRMGTGLGSLLL